MLLNLRTVVSSNLGTYLRLNLESLQRFFGATLLEARLAQIKTQGKEELLDMIVMVDEAIKLNTA